MYYGQTEMLEHPDTIAIVRSDFRSEILSHFDQHYTFYSKQKGCDWIKLIDDCTTLQLRALALRLRFHPELKILPCNPFDYLAIQEGFIMLGIEVDGYIHS